MAFGDYQYEIYFQGLSGVVPGLPMAFAELESRAQMALPPSVWSYVVGGPATSAPSAPTMRPSTGGV
ncbi:lactate 2-monooxygenase domain protein [Mycobacterium ulcerans str. Harvey]|uniref:Lactate 2-monooxygenase domain protein n=1 Tax=Mycobacterium ulcerans str. Harvey TaxID=1299332 RepID=A0ABP3AG68_MYCUL|nr:lactate 2-monooxygenase domain protein [Mycobacterium ulcerans str. Harvey]